MDLFTTTPSPLVIHLLPLAPGVHAIRRLLDVLAWSATWEESVLALALWWSVVLFADLTLKFFFPLALFFVLALRRYSDPAPPDAPPLPATESTVLVLIDDLAAIHDLLPVPPLPPPSLRVLAFLYPPYLLLTHFVSLRICLALAGTLFLVYRARWARNARAALARSAHLRWLFYHVYAFISGTPLPAPPTTPPPEYVSRPVSGATAYTDAPDAPPASPPLRFLFTVYENQRWWVGLDWTAALLPGERPSWCSASHAPLPPPSSFSLPSPTTSYVPVGKHGRAMRTASWSWEEPEWRVLVHKDAHDGLYRVEKTPPKDKDSQDDSGTAARIIRAARSKDREPSQSPERDKHPDQPIPTHEDDILTDPDGWVYGDNKWEGPTSKGGMGKYTRYRRWTRIAVLTESVELVGPGDFGVVRDSTAFSVATATTTTTNSSSMVTAAVASPTASNFSDWESTGSAPDHPRDQNPSTSARGALRQRLKAVMDGSGH